MTQPTSETATAAATPEPSLAGYGVGGGTESKADRIDRAIRTQDRPEAIKGAVFKVSREEEEALWGDWPWLRSRQQAEWFRHFAATEWALGRLIAGWVPAVPKLEWKMEMPFYVFGSMLHVREMLERAGEMQRWAKPTTEVPVRVAAFLEAIGPAPSAVSFYEGVFRLVKPALIRGYEEQHQRSDAIISGPQRHTLERVMTELRAQIERAEQFMAQHPLAPPDLDAHAAYLEHVKACLACLGTLSPALNTDRDLPHRTIEAAAGPCPERPALDPDLVYVESGSHTEPTSSPTFGTLDEIIYHNATEWNPAEQMCYSYHDLTVMPMEFYFDYSRHVWDECRHALMGFRRMAELGFGRETMKFSKPGPRPAEPAHGFLFLTMVGETCSFNRKAGSIVPFLRRGDHRSAMLPEIDCVDERLHVGFGHKWVEEIFVRSFQDQRPVKDLAEWARQQVVQRIRRLEGATGDEREKIASSVPLFCANLEFEHLDFTKDAPGRGGEMGEG